MNILLNVDEATPEFSVKATSPYSIEIDFVARRFSSGQACVGASATGKACAFKSGDIASVERAFNNIEDAAWRGSK